MRTYFAAALVSLSLAALGAQSAAAGPVKSWGALQAQGGKIRSRTGAPVTLRGMSLFWSQWDSGFYRADTVSFLAREWKCSVIRAALGIEPDGYLKFPSAQEAKLRTVIDAAIAEGVYVIVDWHDHKASSHRAEAVDFFTRIAGAYLGVPNLIFEIYNEPLKTESWESVKSYSEAVIEAIRATGNRNLVLVGSPSWSQDLDKAAASPIQGQRLTNIAYTLHFYAGTHGESLRDKARVALEAGLAVFVSEWGTCDASGNGGFDPQASRDWLDFCDEEGLSWCNWSFNNKAETASALKRTVRPGAPWQDKDLSESGLFVKKELLAAASRGDKI
jgi:endoglucanase